MTLARFLAEVRARARTPNPDSIDPLGVILPRVGLNAHTAESRALRKAALAVIATEGEMADADLWALGKDALGLLDAFALRRLTGGSTALEVDVFASRLKAEAPANQSR